MRLVSSQRGFCPALPRAALVAALAFANTALSAGHAAAAPVSRLAAVSAASREPWGAGELIAPAGKPAMFEFADRWAGSASVLTGEISLVGPNASLSLPDLVIATSGSGAAATVALGGKKAQASQVPLPGDGTWLPIRVTRLGTRIECVLGSHKLAARVPLPAAGQPLTLGLKGDAKARAVKIAVLPSAMAVLDLEASAPATPDAERSPNDCPVFERNSLEPGLFEADGVPFLVGERPVDVQHAQRGADFSRRLKLYTWMPASPARPVGEAVGPSYTWLHVLAYSRPIPGTVPRMTVSYGDCVNLAGLMDETTVDVPDFAAAEAAGAHVVSRVPVQVAGGGTGWLHHLRIPVASSANYWFRPHTSFEFSRAKEDIHNQPDPNEFNRMPVGLPSSVVVVAATAERAPVEFAPVLGEPGNVFHETAPAVVTVSLGNRLDGRFAGRIRARSAGPGTPEERNVERSEWTVEQTVSLAPGETRKFPIEVMPEARRRRGWFTLEIAVEREDGLPVQVYRTTYAILAPDTRKALADSPFGTWEFWGVHTLFSQGRRHAWDIAALMNKMGFRWTYGGDARGRGTTDGPTAEQLFDQFKVTYTINNVPKGYQRGTGWWDEKEFEEKIAPKLRETAAAAPRGVERVYKVLHESRPSDTFLRRYSELLGGKPYDFPAAEKQQVDEQFVNVVKFCRAVKQADPGARICLVNDYPGVGVEYMKRGMPKDAFDYFGTEGANFMREPERQPDWLCLLGIAQQWKRSREQYGYLDKPVWTTEALYHATNPGNLGLHAQSVIQTREAMLALANGIGRMCAAGCLRDVTDDYRWSNWGQCGFCFREPEINPKPSFAMYAWLTQVLDQAAFAGTVPHDSTALHVLDFAKPDGTHVYPVWCVRGRQDVSLSIGGGTPVVFDAYGNTVPAAAADGRLTVAACDTPLYVTGATVTGVASRRPLDEDDEKNETLLDFDDPELFTVAAEPSRTLEASWDYPRLKGDFGLEHAAADGATVLRAELREDADPRKLLHRYVELRLAKSIEIAGPVEAFTVRVKGNGGWGRVMFELVDAEGRVWTSCGNQYAGSCNASEVRGDSYVSFDGWRTLVVRAPGRFPANDLVAYRSSSCEWWPENTPEWRQQLAENERAIREWPAIREAHEKAVREHEAAKTAYAAAKAVYDAARAEHTAAVRAMPVKQAEYRKARAAYDAAVKAGDKTAKEPVPPQTPPPPTLAAPTPPKPLPKPPVEPPPASKLRNYGIAAVTYPVRLTKVFVAASPHILYVDKEVPVRDRTVLLDRVGVRYASAK